MRIVIDMQGAQTESRFRGIGHYTMSLALAIVQNRGEHEIFLALNGLFPDTIMPIRDVFRSLLPQENIRVWHAPGPVKECEAGNDARREIAELIREAFLASLNPDIVLISNLFEGYMDDAVTSIGLLENNHPVCIFIYDSNTEQEYLPDPIQYKSFYQRKVGFLKKAFFLFSTSKNTSQKISCIFTFPSEKIIDLSFTTYSSFEIFSCQKTQKKDKKNNLCNYFNLEAKNIIKTIEKNVFTWHHGRLSKKDSKTKPRLKLAFVSPLPPEQTGIADYSAELIPVLHQYYDIDVITDQKNISVDFITKNCGIYDVKWFSAHYNRYHRVLYHFGNSPYHQHMFNLIKKIPGVIVLHDFYLGHVIAYMDSSNKKNFWLKELYNSHGYQAVQQFFSCSDKADILWNFPCNRAAIEPAIGVLVHSKHAKKLGEQWMNKKLVHNWATIPLLRSPAKKTDKISLRLSLGLTATNFIVCSFGSLGSAKQNIRLLDAWVQSQLNGNPDCSLIFVGGSSDEIYNQKINNFIRTKKLKKQVFITGWVDTKSFKKYLEATDLAVQLRKYSRGETSAAVYDCLNYGLPTIINAHGTMGELPSETVWMLPDNFTTEELVNALETLWKNQQKRHNLSKQASELVQKSHNPEYCASQYCHSVELFYSKHQDYHSVLLDKIAQKMLASNATVPENLIKISKSIAETFPATKLQKTFFLDVTTTAQTHLKTGIERVACSLITALIESPPPGYRVEPVYLTNQPHGKWHYRYARKFTMGLLGCPTEALQDEIAEPTSNDIILGLDISSSKLIDAVTSGLFKKLRNDEILVYFLVYDLLPLLLPQTFPSESNLHHEKWLSAIANFDGAICISKSVAKDMKSWYFQKNHERSKYYQISSFHLGADFKKSCLNQISSQQNVSFLTECSASSTFLMVGTIEPRKGHLLIIDAFTELWNNNNHEVRLVIVGREGWLDLPDHMRRNIPKITSRLHNHPERDKKLFWLDNVDDGYLEKIYHSCTCLIAASEGEGFGLPLIEAAQYGIPIIARDIPVFREVAGGHAFYFSATSPEEMSSAIEEWLSLYQSDKHPKSVTMPFLTWKESAEQLKAILFQK